MFGYKNFLDVIKAFFINIFTLFIPYFPKPLIRFISGILGLFSFLILKRRRRAIIEVMKVIKPEASNREIAGLACRSLINYALNFADFMYLYHMKPKELISITEATGIEHLREILKRKQGVVIVTAHLGNWEVGANFFAAAGFPILGIVESAGPGEKFYKLFKRYREHFGMVIVSLEERSVGFKMRRFLKKGYIIGLVGDRDIAGTGIEVMFFNRRSILPQGPAFLSLVTKTPIVTVFFLRNKKGGEKVYRAIVEEEIIFHPAGTMKDNVRELTQVLANRLEKMIKEYPDQWFSFPPPWELWKNKKQQ